MPVATGVAWFVCVGMPHCLSVCFCLSIGHNRQPYKNLLADRGAVKRVDSGGPEDRITK